MFGKLGHLILKYFWNQWKFLISVNQSDAVSEKILKWFADQILVIYKTYF